MGIEKSALSETFLMDLSDEKTVDISQSCFSAAEIGCILILVHVLAKAEASSLCCLECNGIPILYPLLRWRVSSYTAGRAPANSPAGNSPTKLIIIRDLSIYKIWLNGIKMVKIWYCCSSTESILFSHSSLQD